MSGTDQRARTARGASIPLLRAIELRRFRLVIATILVLLGIALSVTRMATFDLADPSRIHDFAAHYYAAERMLAGSSPCATAQLESVTDAYCYECYLYPPFFAQVISPIALVPLEAARLIWFFIGYGAAFASAWLATGIGGARRSLERAIWCLAVVLLSEAVASAVWVGNVGTLVALSATMVAMGGVAAGVGAGLGTLLKAAPGTLIPAVLTADRESRTALVATVAIVVGCLFLLAPQAWLEYPTVLRNVFAAPSNSAANLSIWQAASSWGWGPDAVRFVRLAMLSVGGVSVAISVWLARQRGGMPAAALLGSVAMLVIPSTLWTHYLVVLLPFAAMAWPRAGAGVRGLLLLSAVMVGLTPYWHHFLLVYGGSALLAASAGWMLWPRRSGAYSADATAHAEHA